MELINSDDIFNSNNDETCSVVSSPQLTDASASKITSFVPQSSTSTSFLSPLSTDVATFTCVRIKVQTDCAQKSTPQPPSSLLPPLSSSTSNNPQTLTHQCGKNKKN